MYVYLSMTIVPIDTYNQYAHECTYMYHVSWYSYKEATTILNTKYIDDFQNDSFVASYFPCSFLAHFSILDTVIRSFYVQQLVYFA